MSKTEISTDVLWASGTGRVVRFRDIVRVDGIRGRWRVSIRQPFAPDAVLVQAVDRTGRPTGATRTVRPERLHVRRADTRRMAA